MTRQTAIFINVDGGETRLTPRLVVIWSQSGCQNGDKLPLETYLKMIKTAK